VYWFWWTVYIGFAGGSNASRVRRAAQHIRDIASGSEPEKSMPPGVALAPPHRFFDFRQSRAKALSLRMAEECDRVLHTATVEALSQRGSEMLLPLVPRSVLRSAGRLEDLDRQRLSALLSSPANRIVILPEEATAIREGVQNGNLLEDQLKAYMIPERDSQGGGWELFLKKRLDRLTELESNFAKRMGLLRGT
jgi:hypothetical protein